MARAKAEKPYTFVRSAILFRTEEEAQACVTTLKLMWSVS